MQLLQETTFSRRCLPTGWVEEFRHFSFEEGWLRIGPAAFFRIPIPGEAWGEVAIEIELAPLPGHRPPLIELGDGMMTLTTHLQPGYHTIAVASRGTVAEVVEGQNSGGICRKVTFTVSGKKLGIAINGEPILSAPYPGGGRKGAGGVVELGFWSDALVERIRLLGREPQPHEVALAPTDSFHLEVAVDFVSDLQYAPWNARMFDQLFSRFQRWGIARCHWIDYGARSNQWLQRAWGPSGLHAQQTFANVEEIFPAAVEAAHAYGVEIYALFKPFEMGLSYTLGSGTPLAKARGVRKRLGGEIFWIDEFAATHPHYAMARRPDASGPGDGAPVTRIEIVKEDALPAAITVNDLELFVSQDNVTYTPYDGKILREERVEAVALREPTPSGGRTTAHQKECRVLRLSGLRISAPFFAFAVREGAGTFAHSLINLARVFDREGEVQRLTLGITARKSGGEATDGATLKFNPLDFRRDGVEFDLGPGTPTAVFPGINLLAARHVFDSGEQFVAFARGRERGTVAALSPSYPEVRAEWLARVQASLEAGADGVELRVRHHHSPLNWGEFGFEEPVRERFLKRYGVDLWKSDDFDREAWRKLRGEDYTQFCREARALVNRFGKQMGLHISPGEHVPHGFPGAMEIDWDWRGWISEGLADTLTLKEICPGSMGAREVMKEAQAHGLPVIYSPYANHLWSRPGGAQVCEERLRLARAYGCHGFQLYENAGFLSGNAQGDLILRDPAIEEWLQNFRTATP